MHQPTQTLEFEREREAYIDGAKQLLAPPPPPPPPPRPSTEAVAAATGGNVESGDRALGRAARATGENWGDDRDDGHRQQRRQDRHGLRRSRPGGGGGGGGVGRSRAASLREAREEGRLASEEIRTLQHRKADARVRLQAERLRYVLRTHVCTFRACASTRMFARLG